MITVCRSLVARGREGGRGERGEGTYCVTRPTMKNVPVPWSNDCLCVSLLVKFFTCTQSVSSFLRCKPSFHVFNACELDKMLTC